MTGENGYPDTPEWSLPKPPETPPIPPLIVLGEN